MYLGGELVIGDIFVRGSVSLFMRDVVRTYCIFYFLSFKIHCSYFVLAIHCSFTNLFMCCFFSLFMHMLLINCM